MKNRICYLDAAKGICMLFIVCAHTGVNTHIPMAHTAQTTLFFLLSGYFYNNALEFKIFLQKGARYFAKVVV